MYSIQPFIIFWGPARITSAKVYISVKISSLKLTSQFLHLDQIGSPHRSQGWYKLIFSLNTSIGFEIP